MDGSRPQPAAEDLAEGVLQGSPRALGRALSLVEDEGQGRERLVDALYPRTGRARVIGITGAPGSGKSTLVACLVAGERGAGRRAAVVAVDPSSPFSGGALLGDRLRMQAHATDPGVFIRSMASRGHVGGLARATGDAARILDAAGFDTILIETVGVGQSEIEIVELADVVAVVLMPESGDEIQMLKAGLMEVGDVFVLNKQDLPGSDRLLEQVQYAVGLRESSPQRPRTPIVQVSAAAGSGVPRLAEALRGYFDGLEAAGELSRRRRVRLERELRAAVTRKVGEALDRRMDPAGRLDAAVESVLTGRQGPCAAASALVGDLFKEARS